MNPLFNPLFLGRLAKSYLFDVNRVWRFSIKDMKKYQDNMVRQVVNFAYTVPLYHEKYHAAGIHPKDIHGVDDLKKLPLVTKKDFRGKTADMLLPKGSDPQKYSMVSTSGSTGKPVTLYSDPYTVFHTFIGFIRILREHDLSWMKDRLALIADLSPDSAEYAYFSRTAMPNLKMLFSLDNMKVFNVSDNPEQMIKELEVFQPDFIGGYPGNLKILAILKRQGKADKLWPRALATSGAVVDDYTRCYMEKAFNAKLFDMYGATECSPIAFQCKQGHYHVNTDFVYLEFMYPAEKEALSGDGGNIVVTRLFGRGTPVIRYTGLSDFIIPSDEKIDCGINTMVLKGIGGRKVDAIVLPSGEMIPPFAITGIPNKVMHAFKTDKIQQFQIIQHSVSEVEVLLVIDEEQRTIGPKLEDIYAEMKNQFEKKFGAGVHVSVREVKEITHVRPGTITPPPIVISKVHSSQSPPC
jgi:phenylacetate-CoA ligase